MNHNVLRRIKHRQQVRVSDPTKVAPMRQTADRLEPSVTLTHKG